MDEDIVKYETTLATLEDSSTVAPSRNLRIVEVIPTHLSIGDMMQGIAQRGHRATTDLSHKHSEKIRAYAVSERTMPADAIFVAFWGEYRWMPDFVDEHF